jgi:putative hemolysin
MAGGGGAGAGLALALASEPTRFLSTVQVGITAIGILNGAIGEATLGAHVRQGLAQVPATAP